MNSPTPRDAATVAIVRQGRSGVEVLLLRRAEHDDPGLVDDLDRLDETHHFQRAALRECFEEAGILLAVDADGHWPEYSAPMASSLRDLRRRVLQRTLGIEAMCVELGLLPAYAQMHFVAHWLTPVGYPKRFDTRFFLSLVPADSCVSVDRHEIADHEWLSPAAALLSGKRLMRPTEVLLEALQKFQSAVEVKDWAVRQREVRKHLGNRPAP
jgi:8-oxo-dGTP pyrophosphatase MutT (NUDIX family)